MVIMVYRIYIVMSVFILQLALVDLKLLWSLSPYLVLHLCIFLYIATCLPSFLKGPAKSGCCGKLILALLAI